MCWVRVHSQSSLYLPVPLHTLRYRIIRIYRVVQYSTVRYELTVHTVQYCTRVSCGSYREGVSDPRVQGSEGVSNAHKLK